MTFQNFGLIPELLRAINDLGHDTPTPIQDKAIPVLLKGADVIALAQTGTGKTAGFALPMLQLLHQNSDPSKTTRQPRGLILAPTRELAAQIDESIKSYGKYLPLRSGVVYGGVNIETQIRKLQRGDDIADLIVATPGRLLDLVDRRVVNLSKIQILALDEADRMLDMGFINDIKKILSLLPKQRQNMLFSATLSPEIQTLANSILRNHKLLEVTNRNITTDLVNQVVYRVDQNRKRELLSYLIGFNNWLQVLVFTRTKHNASKLCEQLIKDGLPSAVIHGDKSQGARTRALQEFKTGKVRVLVATDIAARGIDIEHLPYVVNFEIPNVAADYVHRIGRTGRAGRTGHAISLVCASELQLLSDIEKLTKKSIAKKVLPGYEPTNNINAEPMNNRSNKTRNIRARQSANNRFSPSEDRNAKYDSRSPARDKFSKPFASKPAARSSEGNRRGGDWQAGNKPPVRSSEGNRRGGDWQAGNKPPVRSSEGNRRGGDWQAGNKPAARSSEGNRRGGDWQAGNKPPVRSSESNRRGDWQAGNKPPVRSSESNRRGGDWQASKKPPVRSSEGNRRGNWQPGNKPSSQPFKGNYR